MGCNHYLESAGARPEVLFCFPSWKLPQELHNNPNLEINITLQDAEGGVSEEVGAGKVGSDANNRILAGLYL